VLVLLAGFVPVLYALGIIYAALTIKARLTMTERLRMLIVLPSIHISWGLGYIRGRIMGARGAVDTSRRKS